MVVILVNSSLLNMKVALLVWRKVVRVLRSWRWAKKVGLVGKQDGEYLVLLGLFDEVSIF